MLKVKDKKLVYMIGINAALGQFLYGYEAVNISSLQKLYRNVNNLQHDQTSLYISILTAIVPFGAIIGSYLLMDYILKIRPRFLMIILDIVSILSIAIQCLSLSFLPFFIGRLLIGIIAGFNSGLVPKYIYGVCPKELSGSVGCLPRTMTAVGMAVGYAFGFLIDPHDIFNQQGWRIFIAFPIITCLIRSIVLFFFLPYQLPTQKLTKKDIQRLQKFYCQVYENYKKGKLSHSTKSIQSNQSCQKSQQQSLSIITNRYNSTLYYCICMVLTFSNQLSGINAILFYAKQLFLKITNENDTLSQMLVLFLGIVQMIASFSGGIMMDRGNKKTFLIIGEILMALCLFAIYKLEHVDIMVILLVFCHIIAYSFSVGPLHMYYASKMLKNPGYLSVTNWTASFLVALFAKFMISDLGIGNMSLFFSVCLTLCISILIVAIPRQVENLSSMNSLLSCDQQFNINEAIQSPKKLIDVVNIKIRDDMELSTNDGEDKSMRYFSSKNI